MAHFFEQQKQAKKKSRNIIIVFLFFLCLQFSIVYFALNWAFSYELNQAAQVFEKPSIEIFSLNHDALKISFVFIVVLILLFIYRRMSFFSKPSLLPQKMGAKQIFEGSEASEEQVYYNVVSEMALASGVPMPEVYVLKQERAVNAFTSGYNHQNANIVVTQGALESFTRDELQAVVAHEFGHIMSGDVRSNINLLAVYFSFSALFTAGYYFFRILSRGNRYRSRSSSKKGDEGAQLILIALGIMIFGAVGAFVSRLVSAMFSRQREYLADALSVQFTRYPAALASALAKIRDVDHGSILNDPSGAEVSAICFSSSMKWMSSLYDTHPPLNARIQKIDKAFLKENSSFKKRVIDYEKKKESLKAGLDAEKSVQYLATMGLLTEKDLNLAQKNMESLKKSPLKDFMNPEGVESLVYALLLTPNGLESQKQILYKNLPDNISLKTVKAFEALKSIKSVQFVSIVDLIKPLFSKVSATVSFRILKVSKLLVDHDSVETAFESFLYLFLKKYNFGLEGKGGKISEQDIVYLISRLSELNKENEDLILKSKQKALFEYFDKQIENTESDKMISMEEILFKLPHLSLKQKEKLIKALLIAIIFDERLNKEEFESFRILCDMMEVPASPINI